MLVSKLQRRLGGDGDKAAMPIDPEHGAFEPDATAAMGEAFDAACKELHDVGERELVRNSSPNELLRRQAGVSVIQFACGPRR
jgi:hypothetical protein